MIAAIMIILLISLGMLLLRAFLGSTPFDRILAANSIATHIIIFIILLGILGNTESFIDISMIYALISFLNTVGFLMYFKFKQEK